MWKWLSNWIFFLLLLVLQFSFKTNMKSSLILQQLFHDIAFYVIYLLLPFFLSLLPFPFKLLSGIFFFFFFFSVFFHYAGRAKIVCFVFLGDSIHLFFTKKKLKVGGFKLKKRRKRVSKIKEISHSMFFNNNNKNL